MAEHTPTPWEVDRPGCPCGYIFGGNGEAYVAKVLSLDDDVDPVASEPARLANAEFIVRACNSHDELLAACEAALSATLADSWDHHRAEPFRNVVRVLKSAVSTAKGETKNGSHFDSRPDACGFIGVAVEWQ